MVMPFDPTMMMPPDPTMQAASPSPMMPAPPMASPLSLVPDQIIPPSPLMGGMGSMDPMSMLADPTILMALLDLMAQEEELQNGPIYPRWYKPGDYPKPKLKDVIHKAEQDRENHRLLIRRIREDRKILTFAAVGMFKNADREAEVTFTDASLVHDRNLAVALVAGTDVNYEARSHKPDMKPIAEKKEQFSHAFREKQLRRHQRAFGTSLKYDEVKMLIDTGRLVARFSLDFDAESTEIPVKMDLLNPTQWFPTWDGDRGMATMTGIYSMTLGKVLSTFDNGKNKSLRSELLNVMDRKTEEGQFRYRTEADTVEVYEFWDRKNYVIVAGGVEVLNTEHKFGFVPFEYHIASNGDPGPTSLDSLNEWAAGSPSGSIQQEIAGKGLSYIWANKETHAQREAILGRMMTELKKTGNPPRTFAQDLSIYGEAPNVSEAEGDISMIRRGLEEEVQPPPKPGFSLAPPILGAVNEAVQRGMQPPSSYGITQNANESGNAIEGLSESGRDKINYLLDGMQDWDRSCAEMALRMERDWGHLLGSEGDKGTLYIDRLKPNEEGEDTIRMTPKELRQAGIDMRAKRTSLRLSNMGALANALAARKAQGWLEDTEALEMFGVQDPVAALKRIETQEFRKSDEYRKVKIIELLEKEGDYRGASIAMEMMRGSQQQTPGGAQMIGGGMPSGGSPGAPQGVPQGQNGAMQAPGALGMPSAMQGPMVQPMPGPMPGDAA